MKFDDKPAASSLPESRSRSGADPLPPSKYRVVVIHNSKAPPDFVEQVMIRVFGLDRNSVVKMMSQMSKEGRAACGVFVREIAETKASEVEKLASDNECLLECVIERIQE